MKASRKSLEKRKKLIRGVKNPIYGVYLLYTIFIYYLQLLLTNNDIRSRRKEIEKQTEYDVWIKNIEKMDSVPTVNKDEKISIFLILDNDAKINNVHNVISSIQMQMITTWELFVFVPIIDFCNKEFESDDRINFVYYTQKTFDDLILNIVQKSDCKFVSISIGDSIWEKSVLNEILFVGRNSSNSQLIYADDDEIDTNGYRENPTFKPDWAPDTFLSFNYIGYNVFLNKDIFCSNYVEFEDEVRIWIYKLLFCVTEKSETVIHISKILFHKTYKYEYSEKYIKSLKELKESVLKKRNINAHVDAFKNSEKNQIIYNVVGNPLVSIVIPSKDNPEMLDKCITCLHKNTEYENYEIIVVDNGSSPKNKIRYEKITSKIGGKYLYEKKEFNFSYMCNRGAKEAKGEFLLFLNDDTEVINSSWLERMLGHAQQEHIGAVGAKLLYGDKRIQHIGLINVASGPSHLYRGHNDQSILNGEKNLIEYNWSAVTGACLMTSAKKFWRVSGFDERFPVAYNDIDLCLKYIENGLYNVSRMDAVLYHYESISRKNDFEDEEKRVRLTRDLKKLKDIHEFFYEDRFYHKLLSEMSSELEYDILWDINTKTTKEIYKQTTKNVIGHLDFIYNTGSWIPIRGWIYKKHDRFKVKKIKSVRLLIENDTNRYIISTKPERRYDLEIKFPWEYDVEFCGFVTRVSVDSVEKGEYNLSILCDYGKLEFDEKIEIT